MPTLGLNRAAGLRCNPRGVHRPVLWTASFTGLFLFVCMAGSPGAAQTQQSSASQTSTPQQSTSAPAAQAPQSGPMVLGAGPDSSDESNGAPAPANSPQSAAPSQPGSLVPWPSSAGSAAVVGTPQPFQPPTPVSALVPVPPPADAGGDTARQKINNECVDLLKMANDLKMAVDKTNKDVLSVQVVRKANDIEQLARRVKDEIRPSVARN